jgi:predicted Zn-dependent protease with MMP-like domain
MAIRFSRRAFEELVDRALQEIPASFARYLQNVTIEVEPLPDRASCEMAEVDDPRYLLGFYHGTPLTERSLEMTGAMPDRISIYQRNIEDCCETPEEVMEEIRVTVLHEIGHHFGLSEEDLEELGYD